MLLTVPITLYCKQILQKVGVDFRYRIMVIFAQVVIWNSSRNSQHLIWWLFWIASSHIVQTSSSGCKTDGSAQGMLLLLEME